MSHALHRRCRPRDFNTVARRRARERDAFARSMAPVLAGLEAGGVCANRDQADVLNALGIPSESGRPWVVQTVAALKYRLAVLAAALPAPPGRPGRPALSRRTKRRL